jgi:hypothetical protein
MTDWLIAFDDGLTQGFPGTSEKFRTLDPYRLCE